MEEIEKLIIKLDIIYAQENSEMSRLTMTKKDLAESARISEHYDKRKMDLIEKYKQNIKL